MTGANNGDADNPAIADWLDHAIADAYVDLGDFCGYRTSIENLEATLTRQATNIRRAIAATTREGAAIN